MEISLEPALSYDYVKNLFQYYIYDMSEFTAWPPYDDGTYNVEDSITGLSDYWEKPKHYPYLIKIDGEIAGFSLVREYPELDTQFDMGQFFVMRKFKRKSVGERAFQLTVQQHPGTWLVRVLPNNAGAQSFWRRVIPKLAEGSVSESVDSYKDNEMTFIRFRVPSTREHLL
jgi:predicted acetyltransferase